MSGACAVPLHRYKGLSRQSRMPRRVSVSGIAGARMLAAGAPPPLQSFITCAQPPTAFPAFIACRFCPQVDIQSGPKLLSSTADSKVPGSGMY